MIGGDALPRLGSRFFGVPATLPFPPAGPPPPPSLPPPLMVSGFFDPPLLLVEAEESVMLAAIDDESVFLWNSLCFSHDKEDTKALFCQYPIEILVIGGDTLAVVGIRNQDHKSSFYWILRLVITGSSWRCQTIVRFETISDCSNTQPSSFEMYYDTIS